MHVNCLHCRWRVQAREGDGSANNVQRHILKRVNWHTTERESTKVPSLYMNVSFVRLGLPQNTTMSDTIESSINDRRDSRVQSDEEFATRTSLTGHLLKVHSIGHTLTCEKCGKTFYHAHNLKEHVSRCGCEPNYECGICGMMFTTGRALKLHLTCKHSSKSFVCEICGKECLLRASLGKHMQDKHKIPLLS